MTLMKGFYFITDNTLSKAGNLNDIKDAISAGVQIIQYRNKNDNNYDNSNKKKNNTKKLYEEALMLNLMLKKLCKDTIFIINDRIDIALAVNADGVHIGQQDMPYEITRQLMGKNKIIGVTVHSLNQAISSERKGASYLGVSPIFPTTTKPDAGKCCGLSLIKEIKKKCSIPIFAIGGINLNNAKQVIGAGAHGICAISAIVTKNDVKNEILKFQRLFK